MAVFPYQAVPEPVVEVAKSPAQLALTNMQQAVAEVAKKVTQVALQMTSLMEQPVWRKKKLVLVV